MGTSNRLSCETRSFSHAIPIGFYSQRFCGFSFPCWNPGLCGLSCSPVVPSSLSSHKCVICQLPPCCRVHQQPPYHVCSLPQLPVSVPPTSLDECVFFNSLIVGLPYSSIFWQFWLFSVFKLVVVLLLVVQRTRVCLSTPPSWPELEIISFCRFSLNPE